MRLFARPVLGVLLSTLLAAPARSGVLNWSTGGPEAGVTSVVAFDPSDPRVVYIATETAGPFRSTDGGVTWVAANRGLNDTNVTALAIDGSNRSVLYAGTLAGFTFKSTDSGNTWTRLTNSILGTRITSMAVDPRNGAVYISTDPLGVFKSTNGGTSFTAINSGLGVWQPSNGPKIYRVALDKQNPSTVYAGGFFDLQDRPMFKSVNEGSSWSGISSGLSALSVDVIGVDPLVSGTLLVSQAGSLRKTTNGGTSWSGGTSGLPGSTIGTAIVFERNSSSNIWYATWNGVYRSMDGGKAFTSLPFPESARATGLDVNGEGLAIAGTQERGVFIRSSGASSWTPSNTGFSASEIYALAVNPASPEIVFAGTRYTGLFKSNDHGRTWALTGTTFHRSLVYAIAIDPKNPQTMYVGTFGGGGFYRSTDGGVTFTATAFLSRCNALAIDPAVTTTIYAGTESGVSKSTNGGSSFSASSTGLPSFTAAVALAIDPTSTSTIYAGLRAQGVYKSSDGGANWTKKSDGMTNADVMALAVDPRSTSTVFAATYGGAVFRSTNGGDSWSLVNSGLTNNFTTSLLIDPVTAGRVYVGTTNGVFRSNDSGASWSRLGDWPGTSVWALAGDPAGNVIHAGTRGGVWEYQYEAFDPRMSLVAPTANARVSNRPYVVVEVEDFILDCDTSGTSGQARGHVRIEVDGALDTTSCTAATRLAKTYTPGPHTIRVSLRNPDGTALTPPLESSVSVTFVEAAGRKRAARR